VISTKITLVAATMTLASTFAIPQVAEAGGQSVPIDYGSLFTGKKAPRGAKAKLKRAAQLAAKGKHCASIGSGFYISPSEQLASHKGEPYMVTCKANDSRGYYNVYFSDADLKASRKKDRVKPVSKNVALEKCANGLRQKFPTARLNALETAYDASKSTSNVLQEIGLTVENQFGVRVHRVGKCIITPNGNLSSEDVQLIKS
jgi:hypothetical protein